LWHHSQWGEPQLYSAICRGDISCANRLRNVWRHILRLGRFMCKHDRNQLHNQAEYEPHHKCDFHRCTYPCSDTGAHACANTNSYTCA
jgi:hypothetical protein